MINRTGPVAVALYGVNRVNPPSNDHGPAYNVPGATAVKAKFSPNQNFLTASDYKILADWSKIVPLIESVATAIIPTYIYIQNLKL